MRMKPYSPAQIDFLRTRRAYYESPERLSVPAWCEKYLFLSERQSASPGPLSFKSRPYLVEPLSLFANRNIDSVTLCTGSQVGKTTIFAAGCCWQIKHGQVPILWVMPSEALARSFSKTRLRFLLED